jgi:MFS family permease
MTWWTPRLPAGGLWRHPAFRRLWAAHSVSQLGTSVTTLALPLIAVVTLRATPFQVGMLAAAGTMPLLAIGLLAGVWVDRRPRRPVMIAADFGRAALLLLIPLAAWAGLLRIELLYAVALLTGVLTVFFDVASQSFVATILDRTQLVDGASKLQTSYAAADVAGPGLAGALVQVATAPVAIVVDAVSFLVSALLLRGIAAVETSPEPPVPGRSIWREIGEGLRIVVSQPVLRTLAASTGVWNLFENARWALLVLFMTRDLGLGPGAIGAVFAAGSSGFLIGTLLPARMARRFGLGRAITGGIAGVFPGGLLIAAATGPPVVAGVLVAAGMFVEGITGPTYDVNQFGLRQAVTPERVRGRVNASLRVMIRGTVPLGALLGGVLAEAIGLRPVVALAALGPPAALALVWWSPVRSLREMPERVEAQVAA